MLTRAVGVGVAAILLLLARPERALAQGAYIGWNQQAVESYPGGAAGQYGKIIVPASANFTIKLSQTGTLIQNQLAQKTKLKVLKAGEKLSGASVSSVGPDGVALATDASGVVNLPLRP